MRVYAYELQKEIWKHVQTLNASKVDSSLVHGIKHRNPLNNHNIKQIIIDIHFFQVTSRRGYAFCEFLLVGEISIKLHSYIELFIFYSCLV